jgi:hypothetical protein
MEYPNIPSALRPVPRDDSMPVPEPPYNYNLDSETESEEASPDAGPSTREDQDFAQSHLITQAVMNDLVRDWTSPQPRLSYLDHGVRSGTFYKRTRKSNFVGRRSRTLQSTLRLRYCNDVFGIVVGPQVKELFQDPEFKNKLNAAGRRA